MPAMKISMAMNLNKYSIFFCYTDDYESLLLVGKDMYLLSFCILLIRKKTLENEDNISSTNLKIKVSLYFLL